MLSLEEYIALRKREDGINEFDKESRMENLQTCVGYVFEYFNQYLDITKMEEQRTLNNERVEKYRKRLRLYDEEIQEWLVNFYENYGKQINRSIIHFLKKDELFLLYNTDEEFRNISYECYAHLVKKYPFLENQTEMLFMFIKDYHRIQSQKELNTIFISKEINKWIEETWSKYQVNLLEFAFDWVNRFYNNKHMWPAKHRKKSQDNSQEYEYDIKQKQNLFNLDSLYQRISNKAFIKGKKQELEILMMFFWIHDIEGDRENYWQEYLDKTLSP
ncbi:hypothetical protein [Fervidibacillus halotolerans]|uniref:Uncharacterized protein n=1 Tax=Fervidibacillus halotolerans TaxID=2980027 RepID=A0A9E8M0K2_9BACI|nr:hypothetical protein [Fervidibacillus halotolerans]WAA12787.1 hypothetical protein OE105_01180 [Fervidibacillus halotolerans]